MSRARRMAAAAIAITCLSWLVAALPATAATVSSAATDGEAAAFARERGISVAEAQRRLGWQVIAPDLSARLERDLPGFGGVWIAIFEGDRVKVGVAGPITDELAAAVRDAAAGVGLGPDYDLVPTRHTMADLLGAGDWLAGELDRVNADAPNGLTAGLRTDRNVIELQRPAQGSLTRAQSDLIEAAKARLGDKLVVGAYAGRPALRGCFYPYCDPPLRGGVKIRLNGACTGGFIARSKVDSKVYQFTAGHCGAPSNLDWWTLFTNGWPHDIGQMWNSNVSANGGDMGILRIDNVPGWDPEAWVYVTDGPDTTADDTYHISSDNYSVVGMRICTTGASWGESDCGYVTQLDVSFPYGGGLTVHGLGRASFCGTSGDSGSPMYSYHVAYGLQVAGFAACDSVYQGIRAAETEMNVNVLHTAS
jgi:hypothetical protein